MLITEVQIRRLEESLTKMRGIASVTLDRMIVIHDIKYYIATGTFSGNAQQTDKSRNF